MKHMYDVWRGLPGMVLEPFNSDSKNGYTGCCAWKRHRKGQICKDSWWLAVLGGLTHTQIDVAVI